jgi:hypothetical protein
MQSHYLGHLSRLLVVLSLSLLSACALMTPLSLPESSVEDIRPVRYDDLLYEDKQQCKTKSGKTKSDTTRPSVNNGSKPTGPRALSIPIERANTAPRPPTPVSPGPGAPGVRGQ